MTTEALAMSKLLGVLETSLYVDAFQLSLIHI